MTGFSDEKRENLSELAIRLEGKLRESLRGREYLSDDEIHELCSGLVSGISAQEGLCVAERHFLTERIYHAVRGLGVLEELLKDESISEIMVNGPEHIFIEQSGRVRPWPESFHSVEELEDVIRRIVGSCNRVINESRPVADARLGDGSRINAVMAPVALDGPILTIRRFPKEAINLEKLISLGSLTEAAADDLVKRVCAGHSILISGGTSAGKTTFLNALSGVIPKEERIVTIEDNAELCLQDVPNLVRLEARGANMEGNPVVSIRDLIRTSLRMRPDRIIVGEVRGEEAAELLQALNTGHRGSLSTIHANSAADTLIRLETLTLMGEDIPLAAIRRQIVSAIDVIVYLERLPDKRRAVAEISELVGLKDGEYQLNPLYVRDRQTFLLEKAADKGVSG